MEMSKWATNPAVHNIGINRMAIAKATGTSSQFQTKLVKPLVPLLTTLHLRAKQILHLARHVSVFHAQSVHIAKQALNLVILLNNLIDAEDVPDDEQHKERDDLEDDLVELYDAMMKWGSQAGENEQANYAERRLKIQKQYLQMFKQRFYFDVCDASTDIDYQISLAYDEKTILFRQSQHDPVIGSFTIDVDHWDARDMEDRVNNTACGSQPGFAPAPSGSQHTPRENVKGSEVGNPLHGVTSDSHLLLSGDATVVPFSTLAKDPEVIPLIQDGSKCAPYKMTDDNNIPGSAHNAQNQEKEERRGQMKPKSLLASDYPPLEPGSPSFTEYELAAATVAHDPMKNHAYDPRDSESQADDNLRRRGTNLRPTRRFSRDTAPMPMFASGLDTPTSPPSSAQAHRKVRRKPVRQLEDTPSEYFKWEPGVEPLVLVSPSEETMPIMGSTGRRNRSIGIYRDAPSSATVPANVQATYSRLSQGKGRHRTAIKESHSRQEIDDYDDDRDNRGQERRLDPTSEKDTSFMGRVLSRSNSLTKAITNATLVYPKYLASKINPARRENKQSAAGGSSGVLVHSEHRRGTTDIESFDVNYGYSPSTRTDINTINTDATVVSAGTTAVSTSAASAISSGSIPYHRLPRPTTTQSSRSPLNRTPNSTNKGEYKPGPVLEHGGPFPAISSFYQPRPKNSITAMELNKRNNHLSPMSVAKNEVLQMWPNNDDFGLHQSGINHKQSHFVPKRRVTEAGIALPRFDKNHERGGHATLTETEDIAFTF